MKLLVPVDGSAPALAAVHHALALRAAGLAAEVVLVNVQEPASLYEMVVVHDAEGLDDLRRAAGADLLAPAEALLEAAGCDFESEVCGGDPQHVIVEAAERYGAEAIVLGARGMGEPEAAGLGSVAEAVLLQAAVPVTVVRDLPAVAETVAEDDAGPAFS